MNFKNCPQNGKKADDFCNRILTFHISMLQDK